VVEEEPREARLLTDACSQEPVASELAEELLVMAAQLKELEVGSSVVAHRRLVTEGCYPRSSSHARGT
jgi:hypothetical protein